MSTAVFNLQTQLEHLQSKYIGTGHADIRKRQWITNQHRDTYASIIGRPNLLQHCAIAEGVCTKRVKMNLIRKMHNPCGKTATKTDTADAAGSR